MNSIILATVSRLLTGLLLVFSVFLLLRGHNLPGGGFSGGLDTLCGGRKTGHTFAFRHRGLFRRARGDDADCLAATRGRALGERFRFRRS